MTSGPTTQVRLVRCPRCHLLLPELADVPLYMCGGCGIVLRAKNRNNNAKGLRETDSVHKYELNDVSEDKESRSSAKGLLETDTVQTNEFNSVSEDAESRSSSSHKAILSSSGECCVYQNSGSEQNGYGDCYSEKAGGVNLSNEDNNRSDPNESGVCNMEQHVDHNEVCSSGELAYHGNEELSPLVGAIPEVDANDESSAGAKAEEKMDEESGCNIRSLSAENIVGTRGSTVTTARRPVDESISSDTLIYSTNKQLKRPQRSVLHGFDRLKSTDTFESTEFASPRSELSGTFRDMSKSPTTRSSHAYYDGSVSSYDGTDDQLTDRDTRSFKNTFKVAKSGVSAERPARDKFQVNSMANRGRPVRNWMRIEGNESPSRVPFYPSGFQARNEIGSPLNLGHDKFQYNSNVLSPDKPVYPEQEKLKLLRMVYELQDQLNKTCDLKGKANARVSTRADWNEKHFSTYHNRKTPQEEICYDLNCPRNHGRCRQERNWSQQSKFSRIPYLGKATSSEHQVDYSCAHCCPPDWQRSAQLPPPLLGCNKGLCRVHPGHSCCNHYSSFPSTPQRYMESQFPTWVCETKPDDQRHKDHEVRKFLREKHRVVKRHFRPIAGAAPFLSCNRCSNLVQLPADFLLFKKKCHQLRCGACSEVLKFSLQNGIHMAPYTPTAMAPPPSEVDDYNEVTNGRDSRSGCHASDCPHTDPVSYSDDYGLSFCKSCSTEGDPHFLTSFNRQGTAVDRKISNGSSYEAMGETSESALKQHRNKYKNPVERYESGGPSSSLFKPEKLFSEIRELPPTSGSPLHRLMGYSSASEVINGL